jgi:hypothetical protein
VPASVQSLVGAHPHDIEADSGALCYTEKEQKSKSDVDRPVSGFWLDRSQVTGKLSHVKVVKVGEKTNVCLVGEGVNKAEGEMFCEYFRILVIATTHIMPFEQLIRPA